MSDALLTPRPVLLGYEGAVDLAIQFASQGGEVVVLDDSFQNRRRTAYDIYEYVRGDINLDRAVLSQGKERFVWENGGQISFNVMTVPRGTKAGLIIRIRRDY